jgi:hypothetical protein
VETLKVNISDYVDMSDNNKGIALLLQAEKDAGKIIQDARDGTATQFVRHSRFSS